MSEVKKERKVLNEGETQRKEMSEGKKGRECIGQRMNLRGGRKW